ncbi:prophage tail fiber assembly protein homolog TfaE [Klebsiella variicola]|uniref:Tail fiber assembly protein n=1 Tax=Enterobacter phage phiT5282H TaxID=2340712 RepID=A0A386K5Y6_9CAUD|nr:MULTISPECIES: tail fiber assembly protein [Enterobacteriaceae]YP_009879841.1 tail fiber assembly [Enterobacter phage phiT5282H]HAT3944565.1 tail fiber assembly protein [Kluyvera ascorbata]HCQ8112355.1 tail fiber assembly protein [Klebsiella quasipneumoniae subsp. similipneumoniae]AYD79767.1 tail fiber assembly protein [Enterobacter phage phiT5282H]EIL3096560.1 tail fiber assembly protein [Escherichia coli]EKF7072659.1 tail fiber assembly protein [Escherichia coli]
MSEAKLNSNFIAIVAGDITVFNYDGETREYLSSSVEYLAVGVGIPANSCTDAPGESKEDFTICRSADFTAWEYVADHRGETVYSTETGEAVIISAPGDYPDDTTTLAPPTPYDTWNGSEWVTDTKAQHAADVEAAEQQKAALLAEAQTTISLWQTELQLGIISDEDKASLIAWMKYIKAVQAVDTSKAPDITWPDKPE